MNLDYYVVDAFTRHVFAGNPAGVCLLPHWLPDATLQAIAAENNLSETAFHVPDGQPFDLRWFTPAVEVDLCGHATLATAFVLFRERQLPGGSVSFRTRSGVLSARRADELIELDFPARPPQSCPLPEPLARGLGRPPSACLRSSRDYLAVFPSEADVLALQPDFEALRQLDCLGIIATAPGATVDFVSRFFAPRAGILEDPVTGSSHSTLIPYWAARLGRAGLQARQVSRRGGELACRHLGDRVAIGGHAVIYSRATLQVPGL